MTEAIYQKRRQRVFFVLSGLFLGTLAMLNILGIVVSLICRSLYLVWKSP